MQQRRKALSYLMAGVVTVVLLTTLATSSLEPTTSANSILENTISRELREMAFEAMACDPPGNRGLAPDLAFQAQDSSVILSRSLGGDLRPVRSVQDPYPTFSGIVIDSVNDEVLISDDNNFNLLVYDRQTSTKGIPEPTPKTRRAIIQARICLRCSDRSCKPRDLCREQRYL
jgi:hypothetical protein